jgi:hypothetical protein
MTVIRKLVQSDYPILENFLVKSLTFSKQLNSMHVKENWQNLVAHSLSDENANVIACFHNEEIQAVVSQTLSKNHPFWFMNYFAAENHSINLKTGYGNYLELCFDHVMNLAETLGYYDFYVSVPEGYANVGPLMHKKSRAWSRYYVLTDCIVPANQYPKFPAQQMVYGKVLKNHAVYVRHAVLKQEHRKENLTPSNKY